MKKLLLLASVLGASLCSSAQISTVTDIDDLALIYIGSQHRPHWGKEQFTPYVMHTYPDGSKSWMFDGFLMIEFQAWNKNGQVVSFGESKSFGAQKEDWERLIRVQLGVESGEGCKALDDLIGDLIPVLGKPGHKHKVVLTLPVAEAKSGATWGQIDSGKLNFQNMTDRVLAMKWYIDYAMDLWDKADFKNIELDGVYWTDESFDAQEKLLAKEMNEYYHSKGLKVYWIPYYNASGRGEWAEFGIDVAYLQPNYYFKTTTPKSQLDSAIEYAWNKLMGLEMEFEGYNYSWTFGSGDAVRYEPANIGLYGKHPEFYQRLVDYIDRFEEELVFDYLPVAYYSGFQAVYDFENSGHPKDKEIMNRLAEILNYRHQTTGWDKEPTAGINDVSLNDRLMAYGLNGAIYIADAAGSDVAVYSIDGQLVYSKLTDATSSRLQYGYTIACQPGVYVVRVGSRSIKVAVR